MMGIMFLVFVVTYINTAFVIILSAASFVDFDEKDGWLALISTSDG
jgi:hypothetical protein